MSKSYSNLDKEYNNPFKFLATLPQAWSNFDNLWFRTKYSRSTTLMWLSTIRNMLKRENPAIILLITGTRTLLRISTFRLPFNKTLRRKRIQDSTTPLGVSYETQNIKLLVRSSPGPKSHENRRGDLNLNFWKERNHSFLKTSFSNIISIYYLIPKS